jgi:hypothetical protein
LVAFGLGVRLGGAGVQIDGRGVDAGFEEPHRRGMPQDVGGDVFPVSDGHVRVAVA